MINDSKTTYHDIPNHSNYPLHHASLVWQVGHLINPKTTYHDTTTYKHKKRYNFRN